MAYSLPNVKPWVVNAANELGQRFGLKTIGGWRASDPYPDHPSGLALDLMINNIPNGHAVGDQMAQYIIDNAARLGIDYIIWNRRSWNPRRKTWANYTGSNPHTDHVHATFLKTAPAGGGAPAPGGTTPIGVGLPGGDLTGALGSAADALRSMATGVNAVGDLAKKAMWLALPTTQVRIVAGLVGVLFLLSGIRLLVREVRT